MKKNIFKSVWAIVAGFLFVVILSVATDLLLEKTGIMKQPFHYNSSWFIVFVILYRNVSGVIGSYITASLATDRPMRHAMIGGFIGFAISITGAIVMWDTPPHWYAIALVVLALPSAWLGGKLKTK
ncbi:MAG: hypothetical protein WDO19_01705 [Bacteroidota bacterium]